MSASAYYNFLEESATKVLNHQAMATGFMSSRLATTTPESLDSSSSPSSASSSMNLAQTVGVSLANKLAVSPIESLSQASKLSPQANRDTSIMRCNIESKIISNSNSFSQANRDPTKHPLIVPRARCSSQTSQLSHSYTLHSLEPRPLKPFKSRSAYIEAMKEDLAEWLNRLYSDLELNADNFFPQLETGAIICRHANNVTQMGRNSMLDEQASNESQSGSGTSSQDVSLNSQQTSDALIGSPSPECARQDQQQQHNHHDHQHQKSANQQLHNCNGSLGYRHRNSATNSSISSIATNSSSASKQRLSFTSTSLASLRQNGCADIREIDWFRVKLITYKPDVQAGTFFARDNICQFILWCRSLNIRECLLFETDDLAQRKNEKSFILCLLEVARIGFRVGMPTPLIIQLEHEIDRQIEEESKFHLLSEADPAHLKLEQQPQTSGEPETNDVPTRPFASSPVVAPMKVGEEPQKEEEEEVEEDYGPKPQVITNDLLSLHERVVQLLCQCTCSTQFPMVRIGDGKYKVGDKLIIFVRILRRHIMVRVGGGWQELSEFLRQKDPCRTRLSQSPFSGCHSSEKLTATFASLTSTNAHSNGSAIIHANNNVSFNQTKIPMLATGSIASRSRLLNSNNNLNKTYNRQASNGQKQISGSVSMSWLSHNS